MKRLPSLPSFIAVLVLLLFSPLSAIAQVSNPDASPDARDGGQGLYDSVLASDREEIIAETEGSLSTYTIDAALDPGPPAVITGTLDLHFVNSTGSGLTEMYLRLYANDERYADGGIELARVTVDGESVKPELRVGDTVAELALAEPLGDGESADVAMEFTTTVTQSPDFMSALLNVSPEAGTINLAHWFPMLAGYDPESGWELDPVSINGDLVFSTTALFDVTLTAPEAVTIVTSGALIAESASGDMVEREYITGPAREFTMIADDDFASISQEVGGTTVSVWYNPGREAGAEAILSYGTRALTTFNGLFGTYPFTELDLVESQLGGRGGIEYSQLIGLDTLLFEHPASFEEQGYPPHYVEYITAHEVAHQWFYGLVGNNHYAHAFTDEGMADASTVIYFEQHYDAETADQQTVFNLSNAYAYQSALGGDQVVDQPTDAFPVGGSYFAAVYAKAGLGFLALRDHIGDEVFTAGLRDYVSEMRFGVAAPDDLRRALEAASGMDLEQLWESWFDTAGDRAVIVIELDVDAVATPTP